MLSQHRRRWPNINTALVECLVGVVFISSHQTKHIDSMLDQCWSTVYDAGPTLDQHWVNVSLCWDSLVIRLVTPAECNQHVLYTESLKAYTWTAHENFGHDWRLKARPCEKDICFLLSSALMGWFPIFAKNQFILGDKILISLYLYLAWNKKKWNESGFRPLLCTYRLNWARRTSWGWWDDTALQTQDSKFKPWRSEAEHATSRSRRLPTILSTVNIKVLLFQCGTDFRRQILTSRVDPLAVRVKQTCFLSTKIVWKRMKSES